MNPELRKCPRCGKDGVYVESTLPNGWLVYQCAHRISPAPDFLSEELIRSVGLEVAGEGQEWDICAGRVMK